MKGDKIKRIMEAHFESENNEDRKNNVIHFDGSFRTEIALEDVLQALRGIEIHVQSGGFVEHLCIWVEYSQRHFSVTCVELSEGGEAKNRVK